MDLCKTVTETRSLLTKIREKKGTMGFVPTMGALHAGHLSLVTRSLEENASTVVSIFVNPTQFNDPEDFNSYPRNLEKDLKQLAEYSVDLVFAPTAKEIYPEPDDRDFDFGGLDKIMEGKHRPGHFKGVAQVVSKLFEIIRPDTAYFGEKDFQQLAVIRKITGDLKIPVRISGCPIIREADGLAMSSRNKLLDPGQRKIASRIPLALFRARELAGKLPVRELKEQIVRFLEEDPGLQVEYFEIVESGLLKTIQDWAEAPGRRACLAVRIGRVRLIDNLDFSF